MPPSRIHSSRRYSISLARRSSAFSLSPPTSALIKPGVYGAPSSSPRSVTFAPNVTPTTYTESDDLSLDTTDHSLPPDAQLFPPSEQPPNPASRRRVPPGKRRSLGYIPRPPNAFMLFRADFVRQKHVPGSIETNHGSLSKIIGNCWRALPLEEKRIWEIKAKQEKEAHSQKYPGYRFRPVHNKNKDKKKEKPMPTPEDERRCEEVAQLLLEGKKGDELAAAIRRLDERNAVSSSPTQQQFYTPRRPSSVPLPHHPTIALPSVPFFVPNSRPGSPVHNISHSARMLVGQRRPSSALPHVGRSSWGVEDIPMFSDVPSQSFYPSLQRDQSPLPEVDTSLFEQTFLDSNFGFSTLAHEPTMTFTDMFSNLPPYASSQPSTSYNMVPMDISHQALSLNIDCTTAPNPYGLHQSATFTNGPASWTSTPVEFAHSGPSSTYSGSPAHSELSLPHVAAPRPQYASGFEMWQDVNNNNNTTNGHAVIPSQGGKMSPRQMQGFSAALATQHIGIPTVTVAGVDQGMGFEMFDPGFSGIEEFGS